MGKTLERILNVVSISIPIGLTIWGGAIVHDLVSKEREIERSYQTIIELDLANVDKNLVQSPTDQLPEYGISFIGLTGIFEYNSKQ